MNARDINHYRVQVDQNPPILIKNASITALIGYNWTTSSPDHDVMVVELSAIDHCGQIRGELNEQVPINSAFVSTTSQQLDMNIHQTVSPKNAAKKGRRYLINACQSMHVAAHSCYSLQVLGSVLISWLCIC